MKIISPRHKSITLNHFYTVLESACPWSEVIQLLVKVIGSMRSIANTLQLRIYWIRRGKMGGVREKHQIFAYDNLLHIVE